MSSPHRFIRVLALLTFLSAVAVAQEADDATRAAARTLGYAGVEAYQAGDFDGASDKLEKAYQVLRVPSLGLWSARALEKRGLWVEATERYREIARLPVDSGEIAVQEKAQADARSELAALEPRLPKVVIVLEGAETTAVRLTVDGKAVSAALVGVAIPLNPGTHRVEGIRGSDEVAADLTLSEASVERVTLRFAAVEEAAPVPAPTPEPPARVGAEEPPAARGAFVTDTLPWILVGTGVAAGAAGTVVYLMADADNTEIEQKCGPDRECGEEHRGLVSEFNTLRTVYPILWISGGVLAAAGTAIVVFRPSAGGAEVSLGLAPGALLASGRF